jgi:hypothetical protein
MHSAQIVRWRVRARMHVRLCCAGWVCTQDCVRGVFRRVHGVRKVCTHGATDVVSV